MNRGEALRVAGILCTALEPVTSQLIVAGSLRRRKETVNDVEILFVPKFEERSADMFSTKNVDLAGEVIDDLLLKGDLDKRPKSNGTFTWGPKNKLALYHGAPVDFFATTAENWWVALVVRTGSLAMNIELTTGAQKLGRALNAYGCGVTCSDNSVIPATSEQQVFELCGVKYREPWERG
jgi:DNA polymerase/3'-5' exonuclease PolX